MARYRFDKEFESNFVQTCLNARSMSHAALQLDMNYKTLCFHAKRLQCFQSNQPGRRIHKKAAREAVPLNSIFNGLVRTSQTHKLKLRLLRENVKVHQCEKCGLAEWLGFPIPLELHHVDGNRYHNSLANIELLCPNCHALTENYRAKNIKKLSARLETVGVEPLKFGEALQNGNPEPSPEFVFGKGVET